MTRFLAAALLSLLLIPLATAGGKKSEGLKVSFHIQADPGEGKKLVFTQKTAGQDIIYRIHPEISTKDVVAFLPFPADDEVSYGMMLQLKAGAKQRLTSISAESRGKYLLAVVNGQVRDAVLIDRVVEDGLIVIWQRISAPEVRQADAQMPRIGQSPKEWKESLKKKKKS